MSQVRSDRGIKAVILALALSGIGACAGSLGEAEIAASPDGGSAVMDAAPPAAGDATSQYSGDQGRANAAGPQLTCTLSQINSAATKVRDFFDTHRELPSDVTINNAQVTMPQLLRLLAYAITQTASGSTAAIVLKNVDSPSDATETTQGGTLAQTEYIDLAEMMKAKIDSTGKAPGAVNSSLGQIRFESLVYAFSKVMSFYAANARLPNSLSVTPWSTRSTSTSAAVLNAIGQEEAQFEDVQGISDVASFVRLGYGDCWADSMWLYGKLTAAGVQARIMGYVGGGSGIGYRHAWVEINVGSGWQPWDYKKYHSQHYGDCCTGTPFVLIGPGDPNPDLLRTGY